MKLFCGLSRKENRTLATLTLMGDGSFRRSPSRCWDRNTFADLRLSASVRVVLFSVHDAIDVTRLGGLFAFFSRCVDVLKRLSAFPSAMNEHAAPGCRFRSVKISSLLVCDSGRAVLFEVGLGHGDYSRFPISRRRAKS
jgi:hypothetical protein